MAFLVAVAPLSLRAQDDVAMFRYDAAHSGRSGTTGVVVRGLAWRFRTGGKVRSTPAVEGDRVVFGSEDGFVYAVALPTGAEAWRARIGGDVSSSPAIAGERVVVLGADGTLRALGLQDGRPVWSLPTGPDVPFPGDPRGFDLFLSSPTISGGTVFVGGGDGKVYAVDLATGHLRWSHATGHRVRSTPAVADDSVYVGSFDGKLYCLDAATGAERWKFDTGDVVQSSPAVSEGMVYVGSRSMAVFGLDAKTGRLVWRRPHSGSWILASPAVAEGKVVIGGSDSHRLEALDARTGTPSWSVDTGARLLGSPTIAGRVVLYGAEDFRVHAADLETGLGLTWDFTEAAIYGSVTLADGFLLAGSDDDHLYAFRTEPVFPLRDGAGHDLLEATAGRYRVDTGDEYTLSLHQGRLRLDYAHYPPGLVIVDADGSFRCPYFFGMTGRIERQPGRPASGLTLSLFGQTLKAERIE
jgi:outer membrane protein assembly factor BamB